MCGFKQDLNQHIFKISCEFRSETRDPTRQSASQWDSPLKTGSWEFEDKTIMMKSTRSSDLIYK